MSVISEILERLSAIEIVKERIRDTGARMEQWTSQVLALDQHVQEIDRRLVRIETFAEVAGATRKRSRRLPRPE